MSIKLVSLLISILLTGCTVYSMDVNKQLLEAAIVGDIHKAKEALDNGAQVNVRITPDNKDYYNEYYKNNDGQMNNVDLSGIYFTDMTPLHVATYKQNIDCIKLLIDKGADVTLPDRCNENAFHVALENDPVNYEILDIISNKLGNINQEQACIRDIDYQNGHIKLYCPLEVAYNSHNSKLMEFLLTKGAVFIDKNDQDKVIASLKSKIDVIDNFTTTTKKRKGAFEHQDHLKKIIYLFKYYTQLRNTHTKPNIDLLYQAIKHNCPSIVVLLLQAGLKVTPDALHLARQLDRQEIGRLLVIAYYLSTEPISKQGIKGLPHSLQQYIATFLVEYKF